MAAILVVLWLCYALFWNIQVFIEESFDHWGWNDGARPDANATIIGFDSETVKNRKNRAKLKTTVTFSDGFWFYTHETNRKNGVFSYTISVDEELAKTIIKRAIAAHKDAVVHTGSKVRK